MMTYIQLAIEDTQHPITVTSFFTRFSSFLCNLLFTHGPFLPTHHSRYFHPLPTSGRVPMQAPMLATAQAQRTTLLLLEASCVGKDYVGLSSNPNRSDTLGTSSQEHTKNMQLWSGQSEYGTTATKHSSRSTRSRLTF